MLIIWCIMVWVLFISIFVLCWCVSVIMFGSGFFVFSILEIWVMVSSWVWLLNSVVKVFSCSVLLGCNGIMCSLVFLCLYSICQGMMLV